MQIMENRFNRLKEYSRCVSSSVSFGVQNCCSQQRKMRLNIVASNLLPMTVDDIE